MPILPEDWALVAKVSEYGRIQCLTVTSSTTVFEKEHVVNLSKDLESSFKWELDTLTISQEPNDHTLKKLKGKNWTILNFLQLSKIFLSSY